MLLQGATVPGNLPSSMYILFRGVGIFKHGALLPEKIGSLQIIVDQWKESGSRMRNP